MGMALVAKFDHYVQAFGRGQRGVEPSVCFVGTFKAGENLRYLFHT